jgi:ethanolamine utilization protein EutQ (cupin superfamily)
MSDRVDSANKLREVMLTDLFDKQSPSSVALAYLKNEVSGMWSE